MNQEHTIYGKTVKRSARRLPIPILALNKAIANLDPRLAFAV